jgi:uncharacterized protein (DUF1501 family)
MTTPTLSRRRFIGWSAAAGTGMVLGSTGSRLAFSEPNDAALGDTLVVLFLRGGADGLSLVAPVAESRYYDLRPGIAVPQPGRANGGLNLNGYFAMHPSLNRLFSSAWSDGKLAVVHAVGLPASESDTRSHFEAQDYWERSSVNPAVRSGWAGRLLSSSAGLGVLPAVSLKSSLTPSLRGYGDAISMNGADSFRLDGFGETDRAEAALVGLYRDAPGMLGTVGTRVLEVVDLIQAASPGSIPPGNGAVYPDNHLGEQLKEVAQLIRANVSLRVACVDFGGWDMHDDMGGVGGGQMSTLAGELGDSLAAFYQDLGSLIDEVTLVTMSEFGRTIKENGSNGTDHGRASCMFVMGGAANSGVYTDWPGLDDPDPDRDLTVTTDFRTVLAEVVERRFGGSVAQVFPGFSPPGFLGVVRA